MPDKLLFTMHSLNRRLFNTTLLRRRNFDGHIVSLHQAGFHWLKNMLSYILMTHYNLPPMSDIRDNSIIGHPKSLPVYKNIPRGDDEQQEAGFVSSLCIVFPFNIQKHLRVKSQQ